MRTLRKRFTCTNRNDVTKNEIAIKKVSDRYIEKMTAKGWFLFKDLADVRTGNAMFKYEMYISIYKPNFNSKKDLKFIEKYK